jgi:hypothetical protein
MGASGTAASTYETSAESAEPIKFVARSLNLNVLEVAEAAKLRTWCVLKVGTPLTLAASTSAKAPPAPSSMKIE